MTLARTCIAVVMFFFCTAGNCGSGGSSTSTGGVTSTGGGQKPPPPWNAAVGAAGTLAQSFDEVTWSVRSLGGPGLWAVACLSPLIGWAAGDGGLVVHTTDGGVTWRQQATQVSAAL